MHRDQYTGTTTDCIEINIQAQVEAGRRLRKYGEVENSGYERKH